MPGVRIRTYEPMDHDRVWSLHREGVADTRRDYPAVDPQYEEDLRNFDREYLSTGSHFWVAEVDRRLIGMVAIKQIDNHTGRLRRMLVTRAWRRQGVATDLLATAEEFCREMGYRKLILDTTEDQTAAHALYEANCFTRTGDRKMGPFTVFDYVKELT